MLTATKKIFSLPEFENASDRYAFSWFIFGSLCTISGSWFSQIAIFSVLLSISGRKTPIAILFICSFIPRLCSPYLWKLSLRFFSFKSIVSATQIIGALASAIQIYAAVNGDLLPLYITRVIQGISGAFLHIAYDSLTIEYFKKSSDINKSNSIFSTIEYVGMTIAPFLGGFCASYFGNTSAIFVDGLSYLLAFIIFLGIRLNFYDVISDKNNAGHSRVNPHGRTSMTLLKAPITSKFNITTLLLNNISYAFLNFLIPIIIFTKLLLSERDYGILMALWGIGYIVSGKLLNTSFCSHVSDSARQILIIVSTAANGFFLFIAMRSSAMVSFGLWMLLACIASIFSIVYLKTSIYSDQSLRKIQSLPGLYNGIGWSGAAVGFLICALLGDSLSNAVLIWSMLILLLVGPFLLTLSMSAKRDSPEAINSVASE